MKKWKIVAIIIVGVMTLFGNPANAKQNSKKNELTSYSVVHALPSGYGADLVDVYVNGKLLIDNATPGSVKSFLVPKGSYSVHFYADGVSPISAINPLLTASTVYLSKGNNYSFVAHLNEIEKPMISIFKNKVTSGGNKRSWITFRHIAAAPAIQLKLDDASTFIPLTNGLERKKTLIQNKSYLVNGVYSDTGVPALTPLSVVNSKNSNTVIYIWGAKSKGNLGILKETIPTK